MVGTTTRWLCQMTPITTRHGLRKECNTVITFQIPRALLAQVASIAAADERSVSAWLRITVANSVRRSRAASKGLAAKAA